MAYWAVDMLGQRRLFSFIACARLPNFSYRLMFTCTVMSMPALQFYRMLVGNLWQWPCSCCSSSFFCFVANSRDLQSYLSHLTLFLATESNKFYILVDNRPWLESLASRPAHVWQYMVTKSRKSPFANRRSRGRKKHRKESPRSSTSASSSLSPNRSCSPDKSRATERWFSVIDAALSEKKAMALQPMKKLKNSLQLDRELHRTLYGLIIFEVSWKDVRGINYLNELQTDTYMAVETKFMRRWEFDSINQAVSCISCWFSGTEREQNKLRDYLLSTLDDIFYDAKKDFTSSEDEDDDECCRGISNDISTDVSSYGVVNDFGDPSTPRSNTRVLDIPPPPNVPYKRRKVMRSDSDTPEAATPRGLKSDGYFENNFGATDYKDILLLFRFNDKDLPFKLRDIIVSDLRLLTLLEAGLPSWVIFLQSYPLFSHIYRPWMCPLARVLYVLISLVTVLIGFYDLYKNVPLLKATASHLFGPLFDWIETWDMVSRIKYLGTMLFLHHSQKAIEWFLASSRVVRSFFSVLSQPMIGPLNELVTVMLPLWNVAFKAMGNLSTAIWLIVSSLCNLVGDILEIVIFPFWFVVSLIWSFVTLVILPICWAISEILYAPIRVIIGLGNFAAIVFSMFIETFRDLWELVTGLFRVASATEATVTYEASMWRSLWNDLFSQIFRALRSILNGFAAFFIALNRHRLSIYNHMKEFRRKVSRQPHGSRDILTYHRKQISNTHDLDRSRRKSHTE